MLAVKTKNTSKIMQKLNFLTLAFFIFFVSCSEVFAGASLPKLDSDTPSYKAAEIDLSNKWLNSKPLKIAYQEGKVVLIDFWTYSCINCIRTLPHMNALYEKYADQGLVIIGIHAPEFDFEKDQKNVEAAIKKFGIKYPVAMDNDLKTWRNFNNQYWPAHYLIDQAGSVVYTHFGEGEYEKMENNIRALLKIPNKVEEKKSDLSWFGLTKQTPETYFGFLRMQRNANEDRKNFYFPAELPLHNFAFSGKWAVKGEYAEVLENKGALRLNFQAKKVFFVMESKDKKPVEVVVKIDGRKITAAESGVDVVDGVIKVSESRLYEVVSLKKSSNEIVELEAKRGGLRVYAVTFGN